MMKTKLFSFAIILLIGISSCKTKEKTVASPRKPVDCTNTSYTYETDIKPIMESNCVRCHNTNMKAGYNFGEIASVKKAAANGFLLGTIKHESGYMAMPAYADPLDQASIDKIECWINKGMK